MWRRWIGIALAYFALAAWLTWPAILAPSERVPGAERTDLWNSLWSFWWAAQGLGEGVVRLRNEWLDHPDGGLLMVSDPVGVPLMSLFQIGLPLSTAYTLLILFRITMAGLVAHAFCEELLRTQDRPVPPWGGAAWLAGVGYTTAPILLSAVHNGASEAVSGGWVVLSVWLVWRAIRLGGWSRVVIAVLGLVIASLSSWYSAVVVFLFTLSLTCLGIGEGIRTHLVRRIMILLIGLGLVAPIAMVIKDSTQGYMVMDGGDTILEVGEILTQAELQESIEAFGVDSFEVANNLVMIKDDHEMSIVRRSTGAADPMALIRGGDFRSPDFREISRYGENFFHCSYLGWGLILLSGWGLFRRRRGVGFLWLGGGLGLVLALGPVLVRDASAVVFVWGEEGGIPDYRAIPLPYFLLEFLPGFDSLTLVYRLVMAPALALALLAACAMAGCSRRSVGLVLLVLLLEARWVAPTRATTGTVDARIDDVFETLRDAPEGAVMNFPVVGGRAYLYEQTLHQKPLAGTLNFPNNTAARRVWSAMTDNLVDRDTRTLNAERFRLEVERAARENGVRYVVLHADSEARPDMHDGAVRALRSVFEPMSTGVEVEGGVGNEALVEVIRLW